MKKNHSSFPFKKCLIASLVITLSFLMVLSLLYGIIQINNLSRFNIVFISIFLSLFFISLASYWLYQFFLYRKRKKDEEKNWEDIATHFEGKSPKQCFSRWKKINSQTELIKGPWTYEEDRKLLKWIQLEGPKKCSMCAETIPGRTGKQCRERWFNALNPQVKKGEWTIEEDYKI